MKNITKHHLMLQLLVFIWGWTPVLGKLITVQALQLVWFRIIIAIVSIVIYFIIVGHRFKVKTKHLWQLMGVGAIIAIHWAAFYHAIKISTVAVALTAFSTGTLFTSLLEPFFYKRKLIWLELVFGLVIIVAIGTIFKIETKYAAGICFGIFAAFTSSLFTVLNGLLVRDIEPHIVSIYELSGGFVALSIYLLLTGEFNTSFFNISNNDYFWLIVLGTVATAFPFIVSTYLLKKINPFTFSLALNLETIYSIIFAFLIWRKEEQMTFEFYISALLILAVVFWNAILKSKMVK